MAQILPGFLYHVRDIYGDFFVQLLAEIFSALLTAQVNRRHNHVRRTVSGNADDPFAQVGFLYVEASLFQGMVQMNFFGSHGFGLGDAFDAFFLTQINQIFFQVVAVFGPVDFYAALRSFGFKLIGNGFQIGNGVDFHLTEAFTQRV